MIGYKDITFCDFYKECNDGYKCDRALTPEVRKKVAEWWGSEQAPIMKFYSKPECFHGK